MHRGKAARLPPFPERHLQRRWRMIDDLLIVIISLLPTKSLYKFQCVSKAWSCFIAKVSAERKTEVLRPMSGLFLYPASGAPWGCYASIAPDREEDRRVFESQLSRLPSCSTLNLIHSCNGLLLLAHTDNPCMYYVWNPATGELVALPEPPEPEEKYESDCLLAFDPRDSPHFKVVRFVLEETIIVAVDMYSSMTGTWTERFTDRSIPLTGSHSASVYHNGALHMFKQRYTSCCVRFDIAKGNFRFIRLPIERPTLNGKKIRASACIGESRGNLYYAVIIGPQFQLLIFVLEDEEKPTEYWRQTHKRDRQLLDQDPSLSALIGQNPYYPILPVAFHPKSEIIYLSAPGKILSYHPSSGKLEEVCRLADDNDIFDRTAVFRITPCLESINPPGGKLFTSFVPDTL